MIKLFLCVFLSLMIVKCGSPKTAPKTTPKVITEPKEEIVTQTNTTPTIPDRAITGEFVEDEANFYAYVKSVDTSKGRTVIDFELGFCDHSIILEECYGAELEILRFPEFTTELLLIKTKLKDPVFTKYFLYQHKNNNWQLVVNGFSIHQDNMDNVPQPIHVDPNNKANMLRYYSVFDLDTSTESGYTWKLLQESIPILE